MPTVFNTLFHLLLLHVTRSIPIEELKTNGAIENRCDELLHNIVASSSAAPPSLCKGKNIVAKEGDEGIDLNKTPMQKQPKKRKHRPKVVIEGKPK